MDNKFTEQIKQWLETPEAERVGSLLAIENAHRNLLDMEDDEQNIFRIFAL